MQQLSVLLLKKRSTYAQQLVVLFTVEHPDDGQMRRPKHVGANKWEKRYTADAFIGLLFSNLP
jgi:hypothetical protein